MLLKIDNDYYRLKDSKGVEIKDDYTKRLMIGYIKAISDTLIAIKDVYIDKTGMERSFTTSGKITLIENVLKKQGIIIKLTKVIMEDIEII